MNSIIMWFDVDFPLELGSPEIARVVLSTHPEYEKECRTHWRQSILYFQNMKKKLLNSMLLIQMRSFY